MAKEQSRRTISVQRELYIALDALAARERIPVSQLAGQAIVALLAGRVPIEPARSSYELGVAVRQLRVQRAPRRPIVALPEPPADPIGTCANCGRDDLPVKGTQFDAGGPTYLICTDCNDQPPPDRPRRRRRA
jgi:hypothetical protein